MSSSSSDSICLSFFAVLESAIVTAIFLFPNSAAFLTPFTGSISAFKGSRTIPPSSWILSISPSIGSVSTRPDILPPIPWTSSGLLEITVPAPSQAVTVVSRNPLLSPDIIISEAPKAT